jgi:hypothetical protein
MSIPAPLGAPAQLTREWATRLTELVTAIIRKVNNAASLTLASGATSTTMTDARLSAESVLTFMPTTAHAATAHGTIYVTDQKTSSAKINHANTADNDKTFRVAIHG